MQNLTRDNNSTADEPVLREDRDQIAVLTLNRPAQLNALNVPLFELLSAHIRDIAEDDKVDCVILKANGKSFSAGNDLKAIQQGEVAPTPHFQAEVIDALAALPQPTIAVVQGHCFTGALEVVLACDLLICGQDAKFSDTHGKWGMSSTWGMSQRLPRRLGELKAKEMMFTGKTLSGEESVVFGLSNFCVEDDTLQTAAFDLAKSIVANSSFTLKTYKRLVKEGLLYDNVNDALLYERRESPGAGPDLLERLKKF